jgi:CheY-like chemotaxis protein
LEVDSVNTGTAALEYFKQNEAPAVVVLDVNLPGFNGLHVAKHIDETEKLAKTRVIMLTGNVNAMRTDEAEGVDLFLMKPVNIHELTTMTQRLLPKAPEQDTIPIISKSSTSVHPSQHLSL